MTPNSQDPSLTSSLGVCSSVAFGWSPLKLGAQGEVAAVGRQHTLPQPCACPSLRAVLWAGHPRRTDGFVRPP